MPFTSPAAPFMDDNHPTTTTTITTSDCISSSVMSADDNVMMVVEPQSLQAVDIPPCVRSQAYVRFKDGRTALVPVLECATSNMTYAFVKRLVEDKGHILIILAVVLGHHNPHHDPSSSSSSSATTTIVDDEGCQYKVMYPVSKVVIKVTDLNYVSKRMGLVDNPYDEIAAMKTLQSPGHPSVLQILDYMQDNDYLYMVLPYLPGNDLFERLMARDKPFDEGTARYIFRQILEGLLHMKSEHRMAHCDMSPENIMFDAMGSVKIIDLGRCVQMPEAPPGTGAQMFMVRKRMPTSGGKMLYRAPELVNAGSTIISNGFSADIWSCGVILFSMLTQTQLYTSCECLDWWLIINNRIDQLLDHYEQLGIGLPPLARDLLRGMMDPSPYSRLTVEEALKHPWITMIPSSHGHDAYLNPIPNDDC